jgi:hypothetical protein
MSCNEIGQPPAQRIATVSKGDDYALLLAFKINNVAVNLTGWTFEGRLKKTGQTDVVTTNTIDAVNGTVTLKLSDTQTAAMVGGTNRDDLAARWTFNVTGTDPNGNTRRYLSANFYLIA